MRHFDINRMRYVDELPHLPNKDEGLFDVTETAASQDRHQKLASREARCTPHFVTDEERVIPPTRKEKTDESD